MSEPDRFGLFEDEDALAVTVQVAFWWLAEFWAGRGGAEWAERHSLLKEPLTLPWSEGLRRQILQALREQYAGIAEQHAFEAALNQLATMAVHVGEREAAERFGGEYSYIRKGPSPMRKKYELAQQLQAGADVKTLVEKMGMSRSTLYRQLNKK